MKRAERRHLKGNELAQLAASARQAVEARRKQVVGILVVLAVAAAGLIGYAVWRSRAESRADMLLAEAEAVGEARVGPPAAPGTPSQGPSFATEREKHQAALAKFKAVADQHPSTDAGRFARYREGATWMALDDPTEAIRAYQQVIDLAGDSLYGQTARLGLAEAQARAGQYEPAIATFKEMAQQADGPLPVDGILMQLGRAYLQAGQSAEAQQTFSRLVEEFPNSPFGDEARRELDQLDKT